jgi:phage terminase small subunit
VKRKHAEGTVTHGVSLDDDAAKAIDGVVIQTEYPTAPKRLTKAQRELFDELVRARSPQYWNPADTHQVAHYCELWTEYEKLVTKVRTTVREQNREQALFRRCDMIMRRLGISALSRSEYSRSVGTEDRNAERANRGKRVRDADASAKLLALPSKRAA